MYPFLPPTPHPSPHPTLPPFLLTQAHSSNVAGRMAPHQTAGVASGESPSQRPGIPASLCSPPAANQAEPPKSAMKRAALHGASRVAASGGRRITRHQLESRPSSFNRPREQSWKGGHFNWRCLFGLNSFIWLHVPLVPVEEAICRDNSSWSHSSARSFLATNDLKKRLRV